MPGLNIGSAVRNVAIYAMVERIYKHWWLTKLKILNLKLCWGFTTQRIEWYIFISGNEDNNLVIAYLILLWCRIFISFLLLRIFFGYLISFME